jgi:hypothetical protein
MSHKRVYARLRRAMAISGIPHIAALMRATEKHACAAMGDGHAAA